MSASYATIKYKIVGLRVLKKINVQHEFIKTFAVEGMGRALHSLHTVFLVR